MNNANNEKCNLDLCSGEVKQTCFGNSNQCLYHSVQTWQVGLETEITVFANVQTCRIGLGTLITVFTTVFRYGELTWEN